MESLYQEIINILENNDATRFIYDIFNINFTSGPFGVKCWIQYILNEYGYNSPVYGYICNFFNRILDKLANFIGNAIGSMIPDSAGIPGLLIPIIINNLREKSVRVVEKKLKKYYKKIPKRYKALIQNPKSFKQFLDKKIRSKKVKGKLMSYLGNDNGYILYKNLYSNTGLFAFSIHKGFSLIFSLLDIIESCGN